MSDVVSNTPREAFSASELAGGAGGPLCATGPLSGALATALAALFVRRRRAAVVTGGLLMALPAAAIELPTDETPQWGQFELRYGTMRFAKVVDENGDPVANPIRTVYDEKLNDGLYIEFGPQLFQFVEFDFGVGFYQDTAWKIAEDGQRSSDRTMLTWLPLSAGGTLRLHVLDEQPVVPFVGLGYDHILWRENWDNASGGKDATSGAVSGWHKKYGVNILMDTFARDRASFLEANSGINDTWITLEWRPAPTYTVVGAEPEEGEEAPIGLNFGVPVFTGGIKLDF